ncbi:hypothetical protein [Aquimarina celericrescens]|uniref:Rieske domain-containing protein n=1 Tax=Aquimarina celericrescens TaxID=1964542 RepID=A0ABW5B011_9FLAO|nr:hypothetical protein [Aquimarina celericrescens]
MKKILFLVCFILILSCSSDDGERNTFLPNVSFNFQINLNLPEYVNLRVPGGIFVDRTAGRGIKGVIIYNQNDQQFFAYELSDPNLDPNLECSTLSGTGTRFSSTCDGKENIYDVAAFGQQIKGEGGFPLLGYRAVKEGNTVFVSN